MAANDNRSAQRTIVLVHGAWHGGWCWSRVQARLLAAGHRVFTPTLTGLGERRHLMSSAITLETHVQDICNLMRFERLTDVCLVGHSYAGMVISRVAEEMERDISSFVFLDAFVPENGETPLDLVTPHVQADIRAAIGRGEISRAAPPASYSDMLEGRLPNHGEPVDALQTRGILLDGSTDQGENRLLLQIFSETMLGPVFFEFIQRKGDSGFGEGNFKALFESMERDQLRRGVLTAE